MAKRYPRKNYPEGVIASTDAISALQEQTTMDPVTATQAVNGQLSEEELASYDLTLTDIGDLAVASILHAAAERDRRGR